MTGLLLLFASSVIGGDSTPSIHRCADGTLEHTQRAQASAAFLANAMGRPHSIQAQSARLLERALTQARSTSSTAWVEFTSIPEQADTDPYAHPVCLALLQQTRAQPMRYAMQSFDELEPLNAWIAEFTQGQGAEGQKLYQACPGRCSPQYHWWIRHADDGYQLHTAVVCGLPRDRQSNRYELTASVWRDCNSVASEGVTPRKSD